MTFDKTITIALMGNPNTGKTSIFNRLTHGHQHVGNYPGVTVEKRIGIRTYRGYEIRIVDLPGTYAISSRSPDERVVEEYLLTEKPDIVVDVVDATNLERNLYLTSQLIDLEFPIILCLNMMDQLGSEGIEINTALLGELLGVSIQETVANKGAGIDQLLDCVIQVFTKPKPVQSKPVTYPQEIEQAIRSVMKSIHQHLGSPPPYPLRWMALRLLEKDELMLQYLHTQTAAGIAIQADVESASATIQSYFNDVAWQILIEKRYGYIAGACTEVLASSPEKRQAFSDKIDRVLTNRILGVPIFFVFIYLLFQVTFTVGEYPMIWLETLFGWIAHIVDQSMADGFVKSLLMDAVIGGVGGVVVFLPLIVILFLGIAFLEDSGYMARGAFIMDKFMHKIGLHGKSFIPMIIGFGCAIPAIMATRTMESKKDRFITMLIIPLMSCGARLPVYTLLIGAFFPIEYSPTVLFSLYLIGILMALLMAKLFSKTMMGDESSSFVMELPPYRFPTLKSLGMHTLQRSWMYLKKAGTIILFFSVLIWLLSNIQLTFTYSTDYTQQRAALNEEMIAKTHQVFSQEEITFADYAALIEQTRPLTQQIQALENQQKVERVSQSIAGYIGYGLSIMLAPVGLGDWKIGISLFSGLAAKEIIVSTMGTLYSLHDTESENSDMLRDRLRADPHFTPFVAYIMMLFVLLYVPCLSTIAVIKQESGQWRWAFFTLLYMLGLAWIVTFLVYQFGCIVSGCPTP
jgi:ferrous iron transport protein B